MPLALLALGTFTVGTSELVIAGILPLIAADLGVSVALAGQLVTGYALGFGLGAPVLAALTARWPRRPLLVGLLLVFAVANLLAALPTPYVPLLAGRILAASAAGTFEVVATTMAAALVPPSQRGRAIALVVGGFSVALVVGVPLGTLLGQAVGWRAPFAALALLGLLVAGACAWLLPSLGGGARPLDAAPVSWLALLRRRAVALGLLAMGLLFTGQYVVGTYYAPALMERAGIDGRGVAAMLLLAGGASVLGNVVGGYGADRWGVGPTATGGTLGLAVALVAFSLAGGSPVGAGLAIGLGGIAIGAFIPAWQYRLVRLAPEASDLALALNLSALNAGIALGAALGGLLVDRGGLPRLGLAGGLIVLLALASLRAGLRVQPADRELSAGPASERAGPGPPAR